jgi:AcrR family transcriptional regulator
MDEREEKIIDAAKRVIARYGMKRTTMNDIAAEAGIARQTLYNVFANKDEVMRGSIRLHTDRALAAIDDDMTADMPLAEQLDVAFKHLVIEPYDMVQAMPDADDFISGLGVQKEAMDAAVARYRDAFRRILAPHAGRIETAGMTVDQLAATVQIASKAAKYEAKDRDHLLEILAALKAMVVRTLNGTGAG